MVAQDILRTREGHERYFLKMRFKYETAVYYKCLKRIKLPIILHKCASIVELPSNILTMDTKEVYILYQHSDRGKYYLCMYISGTKSALFIQIEKNTTKNYLAKIV